MSNGNRRAASGWLDSFLPVLSLLLLVVAWKIGSEILPPRFFPSPETTFAAMVDLLRDGAVFKELGATMSRVALGFVLAMTMGVVAGTLMGLYRNAERMLELPIVVGLSIPSLCYIIVCFMWFGLNERAAVAAIALTTYPSIAVNIWAGVKAIDGRLTAMAAVFGYGVYDRTLRVVIPQVFPYMVAAARFGFGIVWKVVVVVELLGLTDGVGYQLNYYFQLFDMAKVFAWTLMFTVVMILIELLLLKPIERRVFRWRPDVRA
jgi:NitT/TauT family transport system permease protein